MGQWPGGKVRLGTSGMGGAVGSKVTRPRAWENLELSAGGGQEEAMRWGEGGTAPEQPVYGQGECRTKDQPAPRVGRGAELTLENVRAQAQDMERKG